MIAIFGAFVGCFYGTIGGLFICPTPIGAIGGFLSGLGLGAYLGYKNKCPTVEEFEDMIPKLGKDYEIVQKFEYNYDGCGNYYPSYKSEIKWK